jgi:hypothetical protein
MDEDDFEFLGEEGVVEQDPGYNPLALSTDDDDGASTSSSASSLSSQGSNRGCGAARPRGEFKAPMGESDARDMESLTSDLLINFDAVGATLKPHPYMSMAAPSQSGAFAVAGMARLRSRLAAEHKHVTQCLADGRLANLRGNNVAALAAAVALLATEPDVSAVMHHVPYLVPTSPSGAVSGGEVVRRSLEVDLITDGGLRWIKVKASSPENFRRECGVREIIEVDDDDEDAAASPSAGNGPTGRADTGAPFLETLRLLQLAASQDSARLPHGRRPQIVVACVEPPPNSVQKVIATMYPAVVLFSVLALPRRRRCAAASSDSRPSTTHALRQLLFDEAGRLKRAERLLPRHALDLAHNGTPTYSVQCVNFDVTAMVATCCDGCHGYAGTPFPKNHILQQQSDEEARGIQAVRGFIQPLLLKETLWTTARPEQDVTSSDSMNIDAPPAQAQCDPLCPYDEELPSAHGSTSRAPWVNHWPTNWVASEVAIAEFQWILNTIAGHDELRRAAWLLPRLRRCPAGTTSAAVLSLKVSNKIQDRHRAVFGLADALHGVTISGNRTFVQAAQEQGVALLVAFHPSRALTERKRCGLGLASRSQPPPLPAEARSTPASNSNGEFTVHK